MLAAASRSGTGSFRYGWLCSLHLVWRVRAHLFKCVWSGPSYTLVGTGPVWSAVNVQLHSGCLSGGLHSVSCVQVCSFLGTYAIICTCLFVHVQSYELLLVTRSVVPVCTFGPMYSPLTSSIPRSCCFGILGLSWCCQCNTVVVWDLGHGWWRLCRSLGCVNGRYWLLWSIPAAADTTSGAGGDE